MKLSEYNVDTKKQYEKIKEDNPETVNNVEEQLKKYANLSQAELMQEFIKESKKQKQNGNLDRDKMENIKSTLLPFLNSNQQKQLDYLMGIVNGD